MEYELIPKNCKVNSFYGKAHTIVEGDYLKLKSYDTIVAEVKRPSGNDNKSIFKWYKKYSPTTTRHQKEFFKQLGLNDEEIEYLSKNKILEK